MIGLWKVSTKNGKKRGFITLYILYTLKKKPKSGYEILAEIKEKCGNKWTPSKGTIYPLLTQLENENLIRIKKTEKRSKSVFELTPIGKKLLVDIHKDRQKLKERFSLFRNLFENILGKEKSDIINFILEIKEHSLAIKNKKEVVKILEKCLNELKGIE